MKPENFLLLGIISLFLLSCKDDEATHTPLENPVDSDTTLVWKKVLHPDTLNSLSIDTWYSDGRIISSYQPSFSSLPETLFAVDKDGKELWIWDDYLPQVQTKRISQTMLINGNLLASSWSDNYKVDINSGATIWAYYNEQGSPRISYTEENELVFKTLFYGNPPNFDSTFIMMSSIESNDFKEVFKIKKIDDYEVYIPTVASYQNPEGDTILIFQCQQIIISPYDEKTDLYAYNLSKKEIQWHHEDLKDGSGSDGSNVRPPLIEGDFVYFAGKSKAYCFEKESGDLVWEYQFHHSYVGSNFLLYNDLFITNLDNGDLIAINKVSGNYEWIIAGLSGGGAELRIYDGKIYHANGDLFIIEAETGKLLFQYQTPTVKEKGRGNAIFLNAVAVDLENRMMYTTDGYYLLAMRLPEL